MRKKIKSLIKKCDYFGIQFNFHYKTKEKYHTFTGGVVFIIFIMISISFIFINLVSLIKRENMTIISYKMQTQRTYPINFNNYSLIHSFGIRCSGKDSGKEYDYFNIIANHVTLTKNNNVVNYDKTTLSYSYCSKKDFYNKYNKIFEDNSLNYLFCFQNNNITIQGLYTDDIYQYIELTVQMKKTNESDFEDNYNLLTMNDCTFQLYHIDVGINVENFLNPIQPYLRQEFLKLNPISINKMEIYYLTTKFISYENYLFNSFHIQYFAGFSMFNFFNVYQGKERFIKKPGDYDKVAKYFIRVDSGEHVVIRKYMKFNEFLANVSSIISESLIFLYIIMVRINKFYAHENLMTRIFQFKDIEKNKNSNFIKKFKQQFLYESSINHHKISKMHNNEMPGKVKNMSDILNLKKNLININKKERKVKFQNSLKKSFTTDEFLNKQIYNGTLSSNNNFMNNKNNSISNSNNYTISNLHNENLLHRKNLLKKNNTKGTVFLKGWKIKFKYNLFEILMYIFCPCISWNKLQIKNILYYKGEAGLYLKSDIFSYYRNMQAIEVLAYIMIEPSQTRMIKFLTKPIISLTNTNQIENKMKWNSDNISESEINDFCQDFQKLKTNIKKTNIEKRLFTIVNNEIDHLIA